MRLPWACQITNVMGPPVRACHVSPQHAAAARARWGDVSTWAAVVVSPAMGDQKAPELAQLAHAHLLSVSKVFVDKHMVYGEPSPLGSVWQSVYIDDYCQICLSDPDLPPEVLSIAHDEDSILQTMHGSYSWSGLVRKESKAVTKVKTAEVWGVELNGEQKTIGVSAQKRHLLVLATVRLAQPRLVTPASVQRLVGHWCYVFSMRRNHMCLLQYVFSWLRDPLVDGRRSCRLPRRIRDELLLLCAFAWSATTPCCQVPSRTVYASDATLRKGAVVASDMSDLESVWLWVQTDTKAEPMLYQGDKASDMFLLLNPLLSRGRVEEWMASKQFHMRAVFSFRREAHINMQELLAWRCALRAAVRKGSAIGHRAVFVLDSQVVTNVLRRGRSSSHSLNLVLGTCLPLEILARVTREVLWVKSAANPADDPTRSAPLRKAGPLSVDVLEEIKATPAMAPWPYAVSCLEWQREDLVFHGRLPASSFNSTCGFQGEGPYKTRAPTARQVNLDHRVQPATETSVSGGRAILRDWGTVECLHTVALQHQSAHLFWHVDSCGGANISTQSLEIGLIVLGCDSDSGPGWHHCKCVHPCLAN
eukprot:1759175-Amphidinium_carterae.4